MPIGRPWTRDGLLAAGRGFVESRVLLTAVDLDLFAALRRGPLSARDIARRLRTDARGTTALLDALAAMGALRKTGERYSVARPLARFLDDRSEQSVLPMLRHSANLWGRWSRLTEIVKTGKIAGDWRRSPDDFRSFILAMHAIGRERAEALAASVDIGGARRLIDIGGASGTYTIAFLRRHPGMTATLFDLPPTIPLARRRLRKEGLLGRVRLCAGDFSRIPLPGGHDLALLSAIIHQNSRAQNVALYSNTRGALVPGGRLLIRDHIMDRTRTRPPAGALFAINMLVATESGGTYTFDEIREDLVCAGFAKVKLLRPDTTMDGLVMAGRP